MARGLKVLYDVDEQPFDMVVSVCLVTETHYFAYKGRMYRLDPAAPNPREPIPVCDHNNIGDVLQQHIDREV